ncbi:hypothetical protein F0562_030418 [Nyssa sinensis]|uniref:Uncharacterized protein n=1 Tax=Nyssa sinensis TaxID=561372 RepID=A0A5J5AWC2_9ASTE|nr:hypothetical protein F0562_030418 [Nyssa sinensis]
MPDLGNLLNLSSLTLSDCTNIKPVSDQCDSNGSLYPNSVKTQSKDEIWFCNWDQRLRFPIVHKSGFCNGNRKRVFRRTQGWAERRKKWSGRKSLDGHVKAWVAKKIESGIPAQRCFLPFLIGAPRLVQCHVCQNLVYPGEEVLCSVCGCQEVYHLTCAKERLGFSSFRKFKCPQHWDMYMISLLQ